MDTQRIARSVRRLGLRTRATSPCCTIHTTETNGCLLCYRCQVGTQDGRVKVFGQYGVESLLSSARTEPTAVLTFLPNSGALLRLTQVLSHRTQCNGANIGGCLDQNGVLELFDLDTQNVTSLIELNDDRITCLSLIPGQPYIMLGTFLSASFVRDDVRRVQDALRGCCASAA